MHRLCAQLHFERASVSGVDGRVDALVAVGLWESDVIFYFSWDRSPVTVDDAKR